MSAAKTEGWLAGAPLPDVADSETAVAENVSMDLR